MLLEVFAKGPSHLEVNDTLPAMLTQLVGAALLKAAKPETEICRRLNKPRNKPHATRMPYVGR